VSFPVVRLVGSAHERGLGQARLCPETAPAVRAAIRSRLAAAEPQLRLPRVLALLEVQRAETARLAPAALAEIAGIAAGFELGEDEIFAFLHLSVAADLAATAALETDGCSAFAVDGVLGKNRDFRPEHATLQRVFVHEDLAWGGRSMLCVSSLGAPGAWSSGINSDGLALADTHVSTADHGPGIHRYFLMNRLLAECATVPEALALIAGLPHCGGGNLVIADASGAAAAVELRHRRVDISLGRRLVRTNHFTAAPDRLAPVDHSPGRFETLTAAIADGLLPPAGLLTQHGPEAVCRHPPERSPTLSGSVYECATRRATIALGQPCITPWQGFDLGPDGWRASPAPILSSRLQGTGAP